MATINRVGRILKNMHESSASARYVASATVHMLSSIETAIVDLYTRNIKNGVVPKNVDSDAQQLYALYEEMYAIAKAAGETIPQLVDFQTIRNRALKNNSKSRTARKTAHDIKSESDFDVTTDSNIRPLNINNSRKRNAEPCPDIPDVASANINAGRKGKAVAKIAYEVASISDAASAESNKQAQLNFISSHALSTRELRDIDVTTYNLYPTAKLDNIVHRRRGIKAIIFNSHAYAVHSWSEAVVIVLALLYRRASRKAISAFEQIKGVQRFDPIKDTSRVVRILDSDYAVRVDSTAAASCRLLVDIIGVMGIPCSVDVAYSNTSGDNE